MLVFTGPLVSTDALLDCTGTDLSPPVRDWEFTLRLTDAGLEGDWYPVEFVMPGPIPVPIG